MRIAVVGGTGTLGTLVVDELGRRGHEVLALSRTGAHRVDLATGEGLPEALAGVEAVVDASNAQGRAAQDVLVEGTKRLLEAEKAAGVGHHVLVSIVGIDKVPMAYYRAKLAQEQALIGGGVPWSILRATQFHQLLAWLFGRLGRFGVRPRSPIPLQPIDAREAAVRLADAAEGAPWNERREVAGPEIRTVTELARAAGPRRLPVPLPIPGAAGRALRAGAHTLPDGDHGTLTFEEWLAR